jgi:putative transposase
MPWRKRSPVTADLKSSTRIRGSQFTSLAFTSVLTDSDIQISMDSKGCWRDNIFVERLWKTIKYEEVYLRAYGSVSEARIRLAKCIDFYNRRRPHSAIGRVPPDHRYYELLPAEKAA